MIRKIKDSAGIFLYLQLLNQLMSRDLFLPLPPHKVKAERFKVPESFINAEPRDRD